MELEIFLRGGTILVVIWLYFIAGFLLSEFWNLTDPTTKFFLVMFWPIPFVLWIAVKIVMALRGK